MGMEKESLITLLTLVPIFFMPSLCMQVLGLSQCPVSEMALGYQTGIEKFESRSSRKISKPS